MEKLISDLRFDADYLQIQFDKKVDDNEMGQMALRLKKRK